ncbi:MAG: phosphomannose isomerase type II C-terminal cupin domain [Pseudomonadales bacterium]|nr:phosphomannose isomerase type II C-terminal cupin domain [Pseudomonadales bacterium]
MLLEQSPRHRLLRLCIAPGASLPMHYHLHRSKQWIVLSGLALWESNGEQQRLRAGDRVEIVMEQAHSIRNLGVIEVQLYEMQFGEYFGDDDITVVESARA